jgi:hypothetical protein
MRLFQYYGFGEHRNRNPAKDSRTRCLPLLRSSKAVIGPVLRSIRLLWHDAILKKRPICTDSPTESRYSGHLTVIGRRQAIFETGKGESLDLVRSGLQAAVLRGAVLGFGMQYDVDLENAVGLKREQINSVAGSEFVGLPPGIVMPKSWKASKIENESPAKP